MSFDFGRWTQDMNRRIDGMVSDKKEALKDKNLRDDRLAWIANRRAREMEKLKQAGSLADINRRQTGETKRTGMTTDLKRERLGFDKASSLRDYGLKADDQDFTQSRNLMEFSRQGKQADRTFGWEQNKFKYLQGINDRKLTEEEKKNKFNQFKTLAELGTPLGGTPESFVNNTNQWQAFQGAGQPKDHNFDASSTFTQAEQDIMARYPNNDSSGNVEGPATKAVYSFLQNNTEENNSKVVIPPDLLKAYYEEHTPITKLATVGTNQVGNNQNIKSVETIPGTQNPRGNRTAFGQVPNIRQSMIPGQLGAQWAAMRKSNTGSNDMSYYPPTRRPF